MPESDRGDRGALVALGFILLAIVLVAAITTWVGYPANNQVGNQDTTHVQEGKQQYIPEAISTERHIDPWRDSYAQWIMAIFSVAATGVSIWAVWLLRRTLDATRRANEILVADQRPWLTVDFKLINLTATQAIIRTNVANIGNRPATKVEVKAIPILEEDTVGGIRQELEDIVTTYRPSSTFIVETVFPKEERLVGWHFIVKLKPQDSFPKYASFSGVVFYVGASEAKWFWTPFSMTLSVDERNGKTIAEFQKDQWGLPPT